MSFEIYFTHCREYIVILHFPSFFFVLSLFFLPFSLLAFACSPPRFMLVVAFSDASVWHVEPRKNIKKRQSNHKKIRKIKVDSPFLPSVFFLHLCYSVGQLALYGKQDNAICYFPFFPPFFFPNLHIDLHTSVWHLPPKTGKKRPEFAVIL